MTNAKMNNIGLNSRMAISTVEMLMDMLDMEIDPETGELVFGELRVGMYCDVLASVCSHIKEIADAIGSK